MFVAYEACLQVCHDALLDPALDRAHAGHCRGFLMDRCALLRSAFRLGGLLLKPGHERPRGGDHPIVWDEAEDTHSSLSPGGEETLRVFVEDIKLSANLGLKLLGMLKGHGKRAHRGGGGSAGEAVAVLYPKARPEEQVSWDQASIEAYSEGEPRLLHLELLESDARDEGMLALELRHAASGLSAKAYILIQDIWESFSCGDSGSHLGAGADETPATCQTWVKVEDFDGRKVGKVLLGVTRHERAAPQGGGCDELLQQAQISASGRIQLTAHQVYEAAMQAALTSLACGPRRLEISGEWRWLLDRLAQVHGVPFCKATLLHLQWVLRSPNSTPTSDCLEVLTKELSVVLHARQSGELSQTDLACLQRQLSAADQLLSRTFKCYRRLSDAAERGVLENGIMATQVPAPALWHAVQLFCLVRDPLCPADQCWLQGQLREGVKWRYGRLEDEILGKDGPAPGDDNDGLYTSLAELCSQVMKELDTDMAVHASGLLPSSVNVAAVAAAEYCLSLSERLQSALEQFPPGKPSGAMVQLIKAAWRLQNCLERNRLGGPDAEASGGVVFDSEELFDAHIRRWVASSLAGLKDRCHRLERDGTAGLRAGQEVAGTEAQAPGAGGSGGGGYKRMQLVDTMLGALEAEVRSYEEVVCMLQPVSVQLEGAAREVLREVLVALLGAYGKETAVKRRVPLFKEASPTLAGGKAGMFNGISPPQAVVGRLLGKLGSSPAFGTSSGGGQSGAAADCHSPSRGSGGKGASNGAGPATRGRVSQASRQICLLNSLRQLLVAVDSLEGLLGRWRGAVSPHIQCSTPEAQGMGIPDFGAQLGQVRTEVRTHYTLAIEAAAERLSATVVEASPDAIEQALRATTSAVEPTLCELTSSAKGVLSGLLRTVDDRVLVALVRGVWDHFAARLKASVQRLQSTAKGQTPDWVVPQNAAAALACFDSTFQQLLSRLLGSTLKDGDLQVPATSTAVHRLLDRRKGEGRMSYAVF